MAGTIKAQAGSTDPIALGSTQASGVLAKVGTWDNTSSCERRVAVGLTAGFGSAPTINSLNVIGLYLAPYADGTDPPSVDATTPTAPISYYKGPLAPQLAQAAAQYMAIEGVPVEALKYDVYLYNESGQQMTAGGTLTIAPFHDQYT